MHSLRPGQGYYRELQRQTGKLAKEQKLRKPSEINVLSSSAELNIVFSSRYFQPFEENFDDSYLYIGPVINTDRPDEAFAIKRLPGQQLIYIAVGTLYQANLTFFRALSGKPSPAIVRRHHVGRQSRRSRRSGPHPRQLHCRPIRAPARHPRRSRPIRHARRHEQHQRSGDGPRAHDRRAQYH